MIQDRESYFNSIISQQAQTIVGLENIVNDYKEKHKEIYGILFSIGSPLNDNTLGYSLKQLKVFMDIKNILF